METSVSNPQSDVWHQLGAAIDMLEAAITACPDALWGDRAQQPEYWYLTYHTLFFLDYYLSDTADGFAPPAPFGLEELDPAGVLPERVFTKDELLGYLEHGREKARRLAETLTDESAQEVRRFNRRDWTVLEWLINSMRHVQHHTAQLKLILRQRTDASPPWIRRAQAELAPGAAPVSIPNDLLWHHFGGAIDMLENAIAACPDALWSDRAQRPEYWRLAYHTLYFLDLYLSDSDEGFAPPPPFTAETLEPDGATREQPYTKDETLAYLRHCREKCRALIQGLTDEDMAEIRTIFTREWTVLEWLLYNMRHVQHHAAQFSLILRQQTDSAPNWVGRTTRTLAGE